MPKNKTKTRNYTRPLTIAVILLAFVIALLTYKISALNNRLSQNTSQSYSIDAATSAPSPDTLSTTNGSNLFIHPDLKYSVAVPTDWTPRMYRSLAGSAVQPYTDIILLSPDFKESSTNTYLPAIDAGASIFIRGVETRFTDARERFKNNPVAQRFAKNVQDVSVDKTPAIEYDYQTNGENVTNVTVVKDGIWYLFKFQYANDQAKSQYWDAFQQVLNSFKIQ